jgi:phage tail sheath protein FI
MAINLGVTVVEIDGAAAPTITSAPASIAGLLVCSERGVPNRPVRVRGFGEFVATFGGYSADAFGAHAVRGFFANGGSDAYVVRVVGAGAQAAVATLDDLANPAVPTLAVRAGSRGSLDPGAWGDRLSVRVEPHPLGDAAVPAQLAGAESEPFALTSGDTATFTITTRGVDTIATVTFHGADFAAIGAASAQEVVAAINRQSTAVRAAVTPDGRILVSAVSTNPRSWSRLAATGPASLGFTGSGANSDAALPAGGTFAALSTASGFRGGSAVRLASRGHILATGGVAATVADGSGLLVTVDGSAGQPVLLHDADFTDPAAVTVAEVAAAINRQAVGFSAEITHANRLALLSNRAGAGSTIAVAAPAAPAGDARADLGLATAVPVVGQEVFRDLTAASESYRMIAWGELPAVPAMPAAATRIATVEFDLAVIQDGSEVERFSSLSMSASHGSYAPAVVNDSRSGSAYLTVTDLGSASGAGLNCPRAGQFPLTSGADGADPSDTDFLGDPVLRSGLEAFNEVSIQLLACSETTSLGVATGCIGYCERRGDAMFVGTVPRGLDLEGAKSYASALRGRKVFGALYAPWIQVVNPVDVAGTQPLIWVPPVGQVLGTYARIADARGVWKAPAGDEARLLDALGVEYDMTDADHTDLVRAGGVNGIRALPGTGIVVDASRTLSTDPRWLFVNVRRLFNFIKASLRDGLTWVAQEPHSEQLRRTVRFNVVTPFLLGLWRQGAFGSDPADQVFTVKCDEENNPPTDVAAGIFTLEVYFYPAKPAEAIVIIVGQQDSRASALEA